MGRQPMSIECQRKVKEIARTKSHRQVAQILGISKETVSRIVRGIHVNDKPRERALSELRQAEAKVTAAGCFNVFDRPDWLSGFGAD